MKVLGLMTQKGGTGKTTLAASIGVVAQESGERVFLIDLDPQGSLTSWSARREADDPPVDKITPEKLAAAVSALAQQGYTLVVIDTAGIDSAATSAAMQLSDLCLIPARPSALDIEASRPTIGALSRLQRRFAFVLNQCPAGRTNRPIDASRALGLLGVLAPVMIALRSDHLDAIALGQGAKRPTRSDFYGLGQRSEWRTNTMAKQRVSLEAITAQAEATAAETTPPQGNVVTLQRDNAATLKRRNAHTSLYLHPTVQRAIREIAFQFDKKPHDLYIEGIDLMLAKYGKPNTQELGKK
eukprot:gene17084-17273_t